jgi:hypothetical protein
MDDGMGGCEPFKVGQFTSVAAFVLKNTVDNPKVNLFAVSC